MLKNLDFYPMALTGDAAGSRGEGFGETILKVEGLVTSFRSAGRVVKAVRDVSFELRRGEILGIVGESGSGKSTILMSILRLLPPNADLSARSIRFAERELTTLSNEQMRRLRGRELALIPQRPMSSLSPVSTIGKQFRVYLDEERWQAEGGSDAAIETMLREVGLRSVLERLTGYPHEFSGGQMQRILIAIAALSSRPQVVFADEPTSTLDVTVQAQVLNLLKQVRRDLGISIVLVTHDLGVVAQICDRVVVMHAGELVESADVVTLFQNPRHPYTKALLDAVPSRHRRGERLPSFAQLASREEVKHVPVPMRRQPARGGVPRVQVESIKRHFLVRRGLFARAHEHVYAVDGVSFEIAPGETLALVGESGCGKSTVARLLLHLDAPTEGRILVDGRDVSTKEGTRHLRRKIQLVQQNPFSSLNRRRSILHALTQPLEAHKLGHTRAEKIVRARELLYEVGLPDEHLQRYPSGMSVGELQRVVVARALAVDPEVLILDEPTASLDVRVKAMLVNLLIELRAEFDLTYLWITHEIDIAKHVADRVAVMYLGRIVEIGPTEELFERPRHPYTQSLLASVPIADPARRSEFRPLFGEVPSPINPPSGCTFHTRCPFAELEVCSVQVPELRSLGPDHLGACHFAEKIAERRATMVPAEKER